MYRSIGIIGLIAVNLLCMIFVLENKNREVTVNCISIYDEKKVAITFDDGPRAESTKTLLEGLRSRNVVASFFLVGENITGNENLVMQMIEDGHLVGNHTYTHVDLTKISLNAALVEINKTNELIEKITGKATDYFRPPCGALNDELVYNFNMTPVLWTVDPYDWKRRDVEGIVNDVVANVTDNSIILMHDIYDTSVAAALEIIDRLKKRGYIFVTVEEILIS